MTFNFWLTRNLECAFAVGQSDQSQASIRVTTMDLGDHLVDYSSFTLYQTGPDALVLRLGRRRLVMVGLGMDAEQAFHDLLGGPHPRPAGEHGCHCGQLLPIGLLPLGSPSGALVAGWLDDGNALAVNGDDEDRSGRRGRVGGALGVEGIEILRSVLEDLFEAAHGDGQPAGVQNPIDGLAQRTLDGSLNQALLEFIGEGASG